MRRGPRFFLLLLAVAYTAAGLPRLIVHELHHDAHEAAGRHSHGVADRLDGAAALQILLHGHAHPDGIPEHSHRIAPTIPVRHDILDFQPPADLGLLRSALVEQSIPASFEPTRGVTPPGAGPPSRLHLLCTLLI
jgi:hypothetical protein